MTGISLDRIQNLIREPRRRIESLGLAREVGHPLVSLWQPCNDVKIKSHRALTVIKREPREGARFGRVMRRVLR